jgi:hypothetical protein
MPRDEFNVPGRIALTYERDVCSARRRETRERDRGARTGVDESKRCTHSSE